MVTINDHNVPQFLYTLYVDYTKKEIVGVEDSLAQQSVQGTFADLLYTSAYSKCEKMLHFGGFINLASPLKFLGFNNTCKLQDETNKISMELKDVQDFIKDVDVILKKDGDEAMLVENFRVVGKLFDKYKNKKYDMDFFKKALLQIPSGHVGYTRILLALFSFPQHKKLAVQLYRMEKFEPARRLLQRTFLARDGQAQYYRPLGDNGASVSSLYLMGMFYSLAGFISTKPSKDNYLGIKLDTSSDLNSFSLTGETFYRFLFHGSQQAVVFGAGTYDNSRGGDSYVVIKYSYDNFEAEDDTQELRLVEQKTDQRKLLSNDLKVIDEKIDKLKTDSKENALSEEMSRKIGNAIEVIRSVEEEEGENFGMKLRQNFYVESQYDQLGNMTITFRCVYPTALTPEFLAIAYQEVAKYTTRIYESGIYNVVVEFDNPLPDGYFDTHQTEHPGLGFVIGDDGEPKSYQSNQ